MDCYLFDGRVTAGGAMECFLFDGRVTAGEPWNVICLMGG